MVEHHTCKSESVLNGEAPLDPNDPILIWKKKLILKTGGKRRR
jgi:hypothetical protein